MTTQPGAKMPGARMRAGVCGFLQEVHCCPVVMVCACEGTVAACAKRGVRAAELFMPFARLEDINGTRRGAECEIDTHCLWSSWKRVLEMLMLRIVH